MKWCGSPWRNRCAGGVNVLDTAINYRSQKAERALGRAVSSLAEEGAAARDALFISTKGGYVTNDADMPSDFWAYVKEQYVERGVVAAGGHFIRIPLHEGSRSWRTQLRRSLDNLGLECVDLLYLHNAVGGAAGHAARGVLSANCTK